MHGVEAEGRTPADVVAISHGGGLLQVVAEQEVTEKAREAVEKASKCYDGEEWMGRNTDGTARLHCLGNHRRH
jgi:hypothetical protein